MHFSGGERLPYKQIDLFGVKGLLDALINSIYQAHYEIIELICLSGVKHCF
jgi:hypothetical protein